MSSNDILWPPSASTDSLLAPPARPQPSLYNSYLDDRAFHLLSEDQCRLHPKAAGIPSGVGIELVRSILFGLVLTDSWNHPDRCFSEERGGIFKFTTIAKSDDQRTSLKHADEMIQALLLSASMYDKAGPMNYLRENKNMHTFSQVLIRSPENDEEGYVIGLQPHSTPETSDGKAFVAFSGTKDWSHIRQALSFLPATINGQPTLSPLGCHSGYLEIAETIPDIIGSLQNLGCNDIVLCGHSRGGAIAHLVLLLYLYRNGTIDEAGPATPTSPNSLDASMTWDSTPQVRSIAFASPFVVNEAVSTMLSERGLHHRFLTVVNDGDVIPGAMSSIGGLSTQALTAATGKVTGIDLDNIVRQIGPLIGAAGAAIGYPSAAIGAVAGGYLWNMFFKEVIQKPILTYKPIGRYIFLRKKYGAAGSSVKIPQYLKSPDSTTSLDAVMQHFQTIAKEFATKAQTVADLHVDHRSGSYLHALLSTFSISTPLHKSFWHVNQHMSILGSTDDSSWPDLSGKSGYNLSLNYPTSKHSVTSAQSSGSTGTDLNPELVFSVLCPNIRDVSAQQVLSSVPGGSRRVKLDVVGHNLDFIDMKEGISLVGFFVDTVKLHTVIATTKEKMVVEAVVENAVEKSRGGGAQIVYTPVFFGSRPISRKITNMITIDSNAENSNGDVLHTSQTSALADGTIFDVCINAFKRAVINRSHEIRAGIMGFTPQPEVQERLRKVKAAFAKLEELCPPKPSLRLPRATSPSPTRTSPQRQEPSPGQHTSTSLMHPQPRRMGSTSTSTNRIVRTPTPSSNAAPPNRKLADLIEFLANMDAFPEGKKDAIVEDLVEDLSLDPTPEEKSRERQRSLQVQQAMDEAALICSRFLEVLCSKIDIKLEATFSFVVGVGVVTGLVTALSIGFLIPEAPVIVAGIGMGFLTSTAVGPLGLGDRVIHAYQKEQDNQYRFLLMELVKWIGVPASDQLEFLNAFTHERAIQERLAYLGFSSDIDVSSDSSRWMSWFEQEIPGINGALFNFEYFGEGKRFDRATPSCLALIAKRVEMVRQLYSIRKLIVEETVVAFVGTQDAGKTTAARKLFPHVNKEFPKVWRGKEIRRGIYEHTSGVRVFPQGQVAVADFPGSDSTALGLDQAMRRFGGVASVALLFCHFNGDASGEVLRNLEEIKAGNKVNGDKDDFMFNNELTSREDVERFVNRWTRTVQSRFPDMLVESSMSLDLAASGLSDASTITRAYLAAGDDSLGASSPLDSPLEASGRRFSSMTMDLRRMGQPTPGLTVAMTEFAKELDLCREFGIWGVAEVRNWIRTRISESNVFIRVDALKDVLPDSDDG
ncbi:hypothetical protein HDU82_001665 [Entophlyctis luteolus]|nr:hypothetical protein HDU82_001665 [Entophlyctis luteolus]